MVKNIWLFIKLLAYLVGVVAFCILLPILAYLAVIGFLLTFVWVIAKSVNEETNDSANQEKDKE